MLCAIHKKEMKTNAKGFYCPTPITKSADGKTVLEWCKWKPSAEVEDVPYTDNEPQTAGIAGFASGEKETDWEYIGRVKGLCGMVNARLQTKTPTEVLLELNDINNLLKHIEGVAKK